MSKRLENPELPPGAIVETFKDGGARRNDGVMLTPASQNPWYVLATVAGEQEGDDIDPDLHAKNRRFWNGWMCQEMEAGERAALAETLGLPEAELKPLTSEEVKAVSVRFSAAFPDEAPKEMIPKRDVRADFRHVYFRDSFILMKFCFVGDTSFHSAHFAKCANFHEAFFGNTAYFQHTHFSENGDFKNARFNQGVFFYCANFMGSASFQRANFDKLTRFQKASFAKPAHFQKSEFLGGSDFQETQFRSGASFRETYFTEYAYFQKAQFHWLVDFSNSKMAARTVFDDTIFDDVVPRFFHCEMNQDTSFTDDPKLWPEVTLKNAKVGKRAYTRLRQVAAEIYDPDLEHFFLRQEMRCKARIEWDKGAWFHWLFFEAYRVIADSGISVARPFWLLVFAWAFGFACFAGHFDSGILPELPEDIQDSRYWAAAGVSFGNLFGFLGINRLYFTDLLRDHSPDGLQLVAGAQTVAGVVLLFFLGLGLRNRFRLK